MGYSEADRLELRSYCRKIVVRMLQDTPWTLGMLQTALSRPLPPGMNSNYSYLCELLPQKQSQIETLSWIGPVFILWSPGIRKRKYPRRIHPFKSSRESCRKGGGNMSGCFPFEPTHLLAARSMTADLWLPKSTIFVSHCSHLQLDHGRDFIKKWIDYVRNYR